MSDGNSFKKNQIITFFCDKILTHGPEDIPELFSGFYLLLENFSVAPEKKFFHVDFLQKLSSEHIKSDAPDPGIMSAFISFLNSEPAYGKIEKKTDAYLKAYCGDLLKLFDTAIRDSISFDARTRDGLLDAILARVKSFSSVMLAKLGAIDRAGEKNEKNDCGVWRQKFSENFTLFMNGLRAFFSDCEMSDFIIDMNDPARPEIMFKNEKISSLAGRGDDFLFELASKAERSERELFQFESGRTAAVRIECAHRITGVPPFFRLVLIKSLKDRPLPEHDLIFIETAAARLKALDLNTASEFESLVSEKVSGIIAAIPAAETPAETFEDYLKSLINNLCAVAGAKYGAALTAENSLSVSGGPGFDPKNKEHIETVLKTRAYRIIISAAAAGRSVVTVDGECYSFRKGNAHAASALIIPLSDGSLNAGVILLSHDEKDFFDATARLAFEKTSRVLSNAVISAGNYFEIKRSVITMQNSHENTINEVKINLLGEIAKGIAHNFNNLMAVILGRVGLLQRNAKDEKTIASLKVIENTIKDGEDIIKRMQTFIPKHSASSPLSMVNVNAAASGAVDIIKMRCHAEEYLRNISLTIHFEPGEIPDTSSNHEELQEVFISIAFNAIEAMPKGGKLFIKTALSADGNILISFRDTGMGMSKDIQQKIFIPFFSTKGQLGTGLGLSYSYGVILKHNGNIKVKSSIGQGTEITVFLPVTSRRENGVSAILKSRPPVHSASILIVDDDEKIRTALEDMIKLLGHSVRCASSGGEALDILKKDEYGFEIVFTDLKMPDISGFEIAKFIRKEFPAIKVGLITAYSHNLEKDEIDNGVFDVIIGKPFNLGMIENTINSFMDQKP